MAACAARPSLDHYYGDISDAPATAPPTATALPPYPPFTQICPLPVSAPVHCIIGRHISEAKEKAAADSREATQMVTEYGREDLLTESHDACVALGRRFILHRITLNDVATLLDDVPARDRNHIIVLNLCDGTEADGYPGISVVHRLQSLGVPFTGANSDFYDISTSKVAMKKLFNKHNVTTALWTEITDFKTASEEKALRASLDCIGYPLLVKPDVSYNSCGITPKSKVNNADEAIEVAKKIRAEFGTVYAEQFVKGREFTVLVAGDVQHGVRTFEASERAFDQTIPVAGRFLHLDLLWGTDQKPTDKDKWWYSRAPVEIQGHLQDLARRAFIAVHGSGYARVDIRMDMDTRRICVLEVNANCGVTGWPNTSMGSIIEWSRLSGLQQLFDIFFNVAVLRQRAIRRKRFMKRSATIAISIGVVASIAYGVSRLLRPARK